VHLSCYRTSKKGAGTPFRDTTAPTYYVGTVLPSRPRQTFSNHMNTFSVRFLRHEQASYGTPERFFYHVSVDGDLARQFTVCVRNAVRVTTIATIRAIPGLARQWTMPRMARPMYRTFKRVSPRVIAKPVGPSCQPSFRGQSCSEYGRMPVLGVNHMAAARSMGIQM
jgi:hypothetical protein